MQQVSRRANPGGSSPGSRSALRDGGSLEADRYHRRIVTLGDAYGVATPMNRRVLAAVEHAHAQRLGPESIAAHTLLADRDDEREPAG